MSDGPPVELGGLVRKIGAMSKRPVLYTSRCERCRHAGEERLSGDSHDGEASVCSACEAAVELEWDRGVAIDTPKSLAAEAIERARRGDAAGRDEPEQ